MIRTGALCSCLILTLTGVGLAGEDPKMIQADPSRGIFYNRYDPTFYTGFAPRTIDPRRLHVHVGRGNQVRMTLVLSSEGLESYARDLQIRQQTYHALIDEKQIRMSQNDGLGPFDARLEEVGLEKIIGKEAGKKPEEIRKRNLKLMEELNPGRVFRIEMPADELERRWRAQLKPEDSQGMDRDRKLELLNEMLPTRLWLAVVKADVARALKDLVAKASTDMDEFSEAYWNLFDQVSHGIYPRLDGKLRFVEFTAIHPIGTFNDYTDYKGKKIPLYPTPGRRALTTHQRTKTPDHIPTVVVYSYSPWLPYMHVGSKLHNSFHTLWWRMQIDKTKFLPATWRDVAKEGFNGKPYTFVWVLSRGPMSSGCTHVNNGHIIEMRQILPAPTDQLFEIDIFLNRSYDYDVFDIDGDMTPEVMGVKYFIAYSLSNKLPKRLRVADQRKAYYTWLYAGDLALDEDGNGRFASAQTGRFVERTAKKGRIYNDLALYEAGYEPQRLQFYLPADIPLARRLRQVSAQHPFEGLKTAPVAAQ